MSFESSSESIINRGRLAWGDEHAKSIFGAIISSVQNANNTVAPPEPVDAISLKIGAMPGKDEYFSGIEPPRTYCMHTHWCAFSMFLDSKDPAGVLREVETAVYHEVARVAIFQYRMINEDYKNNDELSILDTFIEDGMVICAVEDLLGTKAVDLTRYTSYDIERATVIDSIRKISVLGVADSEDAIRTLRMGTSDFPRQGYKIGHAIVRFAMIEDAMDVHEMLYQSPMYFAECAQYMIES